MTPATPVLSPGVALCFIGTLWRLSDAGTRERDSVGPVRAFLATSKEATEPAYKTLVATCTPIENDAGKWRIVVPGDVLERRLLDTLFARDTPFLIVVQEGWTNSPIPLRYASSVSPTLA